MSVSIQIHILHCGRARVDRSLPFKEKTLHPAPFTGWLRKLEYQIWLPVSVYLIEHPKGLVPIDSGWHTDVGIDQVKYLGGFHYNINKADLPEGQAIHEQLKQRGIKTSDLDFVMLSHLHSDHES
jgi:N-acyl homoserine lactone hydrolase